MASYARFGWMITCSTIIMFGLMYLSTYELAHVHFSQMRAWMALVMAAAMAIVMLGFMLGMYKDKRRNAAIFLGAFAVFVVAAMALGVIGVLGMALGVPWLFPSLGPSIAIQATTPELPSSRPWNVFGGHLIGLACGIVAVYLTGAAGTPGVTEAHVLAGARVAAAVLAVLASMWLQAACKARHPPAEATTLLLALGALKPNLHTVLTVLGGVVLVTVLGRSRADCLKTKATGRQMWLDVAMIDD